jgi:hypothetical protein
VYSVYSVSEMKKVAFRVLTAVTLFLFTAYRTYDIKMMVIKHEYALAPELFCIVFW